MTAKVAGETDQEIMQLLQVIDDAQMRAMLTLMHKISINLTRNTELTATVHQDFESHRSDVLKQLEQGQQLINKGIGAWRVVAWVGGGFWTVLCMAVAFYVSEIRDHGVRLTAAETRLGDTRELLFDHLRQANPLMRQLQTERGLAPSGGPSNADK